MLPRLLGGESLADTGPLKSMIERHIDDELLRKVYPGAEARRLLAAVDLLDAAQTQAAIARAAERFGRIDVLANIAGGFRMGEAVHETTDATWNFLLDINVRTLLNAVRAVVPQMLAAVGGKIVNVGAASALKGAALMGAYVAAKSAVIRLTETMALELREKNVNVNCVLPTIIDTPENRAAMPDADPKRWVAPEALADVIVFLASDAVRAVHGAAVPVAGLS
ncbi:MAG: SDR family NAD(P)-dependent oxidoreductase [Burkholderiaceae bacterium]|nr:SDR family NAD(P)-dependent oxidoreductase [Burkholderiaceae bacterium]